MRTPIQDYDVTQIFASGTTPALAKSFPKLGTRFTDKDGKIFEFVKNAGTVMAAYDTCARSVANGYHYEVTQVATANLNILAGVAMGAIPASGYGWVQIYGVCETACIEGTTDIVLGDALKGVNGEVHLVKDQAIGTEATYARHMVALEAYTVAAAIRTGKVFIRCL